jgi:hypothetical protein
MLLDVNGTVANCPRKSVPDLFPMKNLPGIKRLLQIKTGYGTLGEVHQQTSNAQRSTSNAQCLCKSVLMDSTG